MNELYAKKMGEKRLQVSVFGMAVLHCGSATSGWLISVSVIGMVVIVPTSQLVED